MKKTIKKVCNIVTTAIVVGVAILALLLGGPRLIGLEVFTVLSGSMEPDYPTGALIYVKDVDYKQLKADDVITFLLAEDMVVTHRIIEVLVDEEDTDTIRYFTQGDANDVPDGSPVHYKNIIGTPVLSVPYLGYVADYIQTPPGMYVAISAGAILLLLVFLPDLLEIGRAKKKGPACSEK